MIEWTAQGIFDYLIVPQDDTVAYGWNIAESRRLRQYVLQLGLAQRVSIYPGTDETAMLLLARYAAQRAEFRPRVFLRYSGSGADQVITAYEDRPMTEMVKAHLGPLGGIVSGGSRRRQSPAVRQRPSRRTGQRAGAVRAGAWAKRNSKLCPRRRARRCLRYQRQPHVAGTLREMHTVRRDLPEFVRSLADAVQQGQRLRRRRCCLRQRGRRCAGRSPAANGDAEPARGLWRVEHGREHAGLRPGPGRNSLRPAAEGGSKLTWQPTCGFCFFACSRTRCTWGGCARRS